jgi:ABC-type spermidine/putrescine transport system permease subunit I
MAAELRVSAMFRPRLGWRARRYVTLALALGAITFFLIALTALLRWSLYPGGQLGIGPRGALTLANYATFFRDSLYVGTVLITLRLSAVATLASLVLGLPLAHWIVRTRSSSLRASLIILVAIPFMTSLIVRLYSLILVLGNTGLVNRMLQWFGIIGIRDFLPLMRNEIGVAIGLTYFVLPFVVFTLAGVIRRLDFTLEEAAANLGADEITTFFRIILPLLTPGVLGAGTLAFVLAGTAFATPLILGGGAVHMIANLIYDQAMSVQNIPMAATLSFVALAFTIGCLYASHRLVGEKGRA